MPLLEGGMTTRRSGLRLFMARPLPAGGGGDFVGITLPRLFAPVVPIKFGEALEFTNPFPGRKKVSLNNTEKVITMPWYEHEASFSQFQFHMNFMTKLVGS